MLFPACTPKTLAFTRWLWVDLLCADGSVVDRAQVHNWNFQCQEFYHHLLIKVFDFEGMVCLQDIFCNLGNHEYQGQIKKLCRPFFGGLKGVWIQIFQVDDFWVGEASFIAIRHLVPLKENTTSVGSSVMSYTPKMVLIQVAELRTRTQADEIVKVNLRIIGKSWKK